MPNITPPYSGSISGWTSTAIGWSAAPARCRESSTAVTAATKASKPLIPMTDSNWPAIDDVAMSSTTEELRATSARWSPPMRSKASRTAAWPPTAAPASMASENAVVSTTPGRHRQTGGATPGQRLRLAARQRGSSAAASSRATTNGRSVSGALVGRCARSPHLMATPFLP